MRAAPRYALLVLAALVCLLIVNGRTRASDLQAMYPLAWAEGGIRVYTFCNQGTRLYVTYSIHNGEGAAIAAIQDGCR